MINRRKFRRRFMELDERRTNLWSRENVAFAYENGFHPCRYVDFIVDELIRIAEQSLEDQK